MEWASYSLDLVRETGEGFGDGELERRDYGGQLESYWEKVKLIELRL